MRILSVHNRYLLPGGEDACADAEAALLRSRGHVVEELRISNELVSQLGLLRTAIRAIWSQNMYWQARQRIRAFKPDVIHVHNFFPLVSPALHYAARAEKVPVVQTLHNYRLICPGSLLYWNGRICELCVGRTVPLPGIRRKCYRSSRLATAAVALMLGAHTLANTWTHLVTLYVALTEFARRKFVAGGLPANRIVVKPNFVTLGGPPGPGDGGFALFVGRLVQEKGVLTMLRAWRLVPPSITLKIAGDGPLRLRVDREIKNLPHVQVLGYLPPQRIHDLLHRAAFLIFPTEWYEGHPRVLVEAFAAGTPVIASRIGAAESVVRHGVNGLHFRTGDAADLAEKVVHAFSRKVALREMREAARAEYEAHYTADRNYEMLVSIYRRAMDLSGWPDNSS